MPKVGRTMSVMEQLELQLEQLYSGVMPGRMTMISFLENLKKQYRDQDELEREFEKTDMELILANTEICEQEIYIAQLQAEIRRLQGEEK